ncbi:hypothetical protein RJ639_014642 [Escallonia herrerae]|uniref:APO domain-containing protein n=1 Tax=Escallonia herrerae TaxID=1293975 RepID=A0AA89ANX3_9ASTE|nr:hypothetical protein RJ639_014642 [Escallonia herrerae]
MKLVVSARSEAKKKSRIVEGGGNEERANCRDGVRARKEKTVPRRGGAGAGGTEVMSLRVWLGTVERERHHLPALGSYPPRLKFGQEWFHYNGPATPGTFVCAGNRPAQDQPTRNRKIRRQNVDLPSIQPKNKKKPYPIPLKKIQHAARADKKLAEMGVEKSLEPPKNGLLVPDLIPVAYEVLDAWKILIKGLAQLLHVVPVHACSECSEVHVAPSGHSIQDCHGTTSGQRRSLHSWVKGSINDVLLPIESYHLYDPFGRRITHETRFSYDRIPAVVELCIQAGVDLPEYPSRRRTSPIRMIGRKIIDQGEFVEEPWSSRSTDLPPSIIQQTLILG